VDLRDAVRVSLGQTKEGQARRRLRDEAGHRVAAGVVLLVVQQAVATDHEQLRRAARELTQSQRTACRTGLSQFERTIWVAGGGVLLIVDAAETDHEQLPRPTG